MQVPWEVFLFVIKLLLINNICYKFKYFCHKIAFLEHKNNLIYVSMYLCIYGNVRMLGRKLNEYFRVVESEIVQIHGKPHL